MEGADKTCGQHCGICHGDQELCDPHDCGDAALQWKFEQFIDFATGGKLSKSTWALETLKAAVTEYVNETVQACADERPAVQIEPWQAINDADLRTAEQFLVNHTGKAAFFPIDAQNLANIAMHCIREVRATRAAAPAVDVEALRTCVVRYEDLVASNAKERGYTTTNQGVIDRAKKAIAALTLVEGEA
jgi:hypothetical protein